MKFEDLEFKENQMGGLGATHTFDNGITISVQASENHFCTPQSNLISEDDYSSFEVAMFDSNGDFVTSKYIGVSENVAGWQSRDNIEDAMCLILEDSKDDDLTKALSYAVDNNFITMNQAFEIIRNIK